jgi:hypothetical protein
MTIFWFGMFIVAVAALIVCCVSFTKEIERLKRASDD